MHANYKNIVSVDVAFEFVRAIVGMAICSGGVIRVVLLNFNFLLF